MSADEVGGIIDECEWYVSAAWLLPDIFYFLSHRFSKCIPHFKRSLQVPSERGGYDMLVAKQWSRVVGGLIAVVVFLFLLKGIHDYPSFREIVQAPASRFSTIQNTGGAISKSRASAQPTPSPENVQQAGPSDASQQDPIQQGDDGALPSTEPSQAHPSNYDLPPPPPQELQQMPVTISSSTPSSLATPSPALKKTIVMGKISSEKTNWVAQELADWNSSIYVVDLPEDVDSPTGLKTNFNKANEATPYLTYIIDHYNTLPDIAVFLHAHRTSWHNDAPKWDIVNILRGLHLPVVQERGFVNLRCMGSPGCPNEIQLNRFPVDEDLTAEIAFPFVYGEYFNMTVAEVRQQVPIIATPCCAQFAVTREQVLQRPREDYVRLLKLIEDSEIESHVLGTVMEYMWHILFGKEAVHCEQEQVCRDALYGYGSPGEWA